MPCTPKPWFNRERTSWFVTLGGVRLKRSGQSALNWSSQCCLTWATRQGYIDRNTVEHLEVPAGEHREVVISDDDYLPLLEFAGHDVLRDLIVVTWESGLRPQESLRVEARHVRFALPYNSASPVDS